jgi:hypothetical protein
VLRHVVCLTWSEDATPAEVAAVTDALAELPAQIPDLRAYSIGPDVGLAPGNADFAIVADFDDADGWRRYQEHPAHQAVLVEQLRPMIAARTAAQFEWT